MRQGILSAPAARRVYCPVCNSSFWSTLRAYISVNTIFTIQICEIGGAIIRCR